MIGRKKVVRLPSSVTAGAKTLSDRERFTKAFEAAAAAAIN